jgi:hypothetical protein
VSVLTEDPRGLLTGCDNMEKTRHVTTTAEQQAATAGSARAAGDLPLWRIGATGGVVGILCCVGPTALALFGVVGAGRAFVWANTLYDGYAWGFRLVGVGVMALLVYVALRRRGQCSLRGAVAVRRRLGAMAAVAAGTYAALYAVTTWLGTFAA